MPWELRTTALGDKEIEIMRRRKRGETVGSTARSLRISRTTVMCHIRRAHERLRTAAETISNNPK